MSLVTMRIFLLAFTRFMSSSIVHGSTSVVLVQKCLLVTVIVFDSEVFNKIIRRTKEIILI